MVKRYWAAAVNDIETNPCLVEGWVPVHLSSDYDAVAADRQAVLDKACALVDQVAALEARFRELEAAYDPHWLARSQSEARIKALEDALHKYGWHKRDCMQYGGDYYPCDCGFNDFAPAQPGEQR